MGEKQLINKMGHIKDRVNGIQIFITNNEVLICNNPILQVLYIIAIIVFFVSLAFLLSGNNLASISYISTIFIISSMIIMFSYKKYVILITLNKNNSLSIKKDEYYCFKTNHELNTFENIEGMSLNYITVFNEREADQSYLFLRSDNLKNDIIILNETISNKAIELLSMEMKTKIPNIIFKNFGNDYSNSGNLLHMDKLNMKSERPQ